MSRTQYVLSAAIAACAWAGCLGSNGGQLETGEAADGILQGWRGSTIAATVQVSSGGTGCSGTVLSDHWILTAAHCFDGVWQSSLQVVAADDTGAETVVLYSGSAESFRHPDWHDIQILGITVDHGIAFDLQLVYLSGGRIPSWFVNRGRLFADYTHPWYGDYLVPAWYEGFGRGSDPGGTDSCDAASSPFVTLRRRNQINMDGSSDTIAISGTSVVCPGDSGGPWMFEGYDAQDGQWKMIQFAVTHGHDWGGICGGSVDSVYDTGAVVSSGLSWIETTMRSLTAVNVHAGYASGFAYTSYEEPPGCVSDVGEDCSAPTLCCSLYDPNSCRDFYLDGTIDCFGNCQPTDGCPVWY